MDHRHRHEHGEHHVGHVHPASHKNVTKRPAKSRMTATVAATTERVIPSNENVSVEGGHVSMDDSHVSMHGSHVSMHDGHVPMDGGHVSMHGSDMSMKVGHVSEHSDHVVHVGNHTINEQPDRGYEHGDAHTGHFSHMMMSHTHTYFSTGSYTDLMIKGINVSSIQDVILTLLVVMFMVILIEALNTCLKRHDQRSQYPSVSSKFSMLLLATVAKMATLTVGYLAMLLVMTMNYWILITAVLASGIGHLIMRPIITACCSPPNRISTHQELANAQKVNCSTSVSMSCKPLCEAAQSDAIEVPNGEEETTPLTWAPQLDKPCSQT
ncbi:uncharacterized protein LOC127861947 [Dreissena polymorpha]|uniref:Copper transport protein n=1 Tax=Dreissena polymorpha TaxID=45954 RepID=A0A9D3Y8S0_DREPO|nr:uncharacterized protein LOC127861947 [Dreissena polymorpha]XP_052256674.1 uncharacterized protein LOC127861947 [Dreissena polymorpha]XP_052256675.1 uncharacterized protein LOC127861947 [Dreissena polymorpha]KAH3695675.1 hypothetical protein DPMN_083133 [Dreissena polymorpha]